MSSSSSDATGTDSTESTSSDDIDYYYNEYNYGHGYFEEPFLELDNIVKYLFDTGLLNDIECRKITSRKGHGVIKTRAAIYDVMFTQGSIKFKQILQVFRNRVHPFQNPKILLRIFSYLKFSDISKCKFVSQDWKQIVLMKVSSKYDEVNLEEHMMTNLISNNEKIRNTKSRSRKDERKASVFQWMLATNPEKDETMLEMLQIGRDVADAKNSSIQVYCTAENKIDNLISKALNNHTVLSNVFQFLSLENIKNCRTVCRAWNSVSEPFLRKISIIKFHSKLAPIDFLNVAKYLPLPDLPFKAFKFQKVFSTEELSVFFTNYRKNVKSLEICLGKDVRLCLSQTTNLTELNLQGLTLNTSKSYPKTDSNIMIPWSSLQSIKILILKASVIAVDVDKEWTRITPVKLRLDKVNFFVGGCYPDEIILNDYIDFTKVRDVHVNSTLKQVQKFDWAKDRFDAERITIAYTRFVKAGKSKSAVDYLSLKCLYPFSEKNCIVIKQLIAEESDISLSALPPSLEKLGIFREYCVLNNGMEQINLPNLNYLSLRKTDDLNLLSNFVNCPNLTDMEIVVVEPMDLQLLPRNIKRLKLETPTGQLEFVNGLANERLNLDILVLNFIASYTLNYLKFDKLRPKILVVEISGPYKDKDFVSFIKKNKNMDKIYVQFQSPIKNPIAFSATKLSNIVDKESQNYEFRNQRGKAITSEEYLTIATSLDIKTVMKGFCNKDEEKQSKRQREEYYKSFRANERKNVAKEESEDEIDSDSDDSVSSFSSFSESESSYYEGSDAIVGAFL